MEALAERAVHPVTWRLLVVGAASTRTPPDDSHASLLLTRPGRSVLIDAGGNVPGLMESLNVDHRTLTDLIITHSHPDHTYGLPFLSHSFYHDSFDIRCWTPSEALPRLRQSLEAYDLVDPDRYMNVDFREVSPGQAIEPPGLDELTLRSIPTRHSRPGFGLRIQSSRQTIVFSGDTAPHPAVQRSARGADVLIHDCQATEAYKRYFSGSHTSAGELGKLAADAGVDVLVPFHYNLTEFPVTWDDLAADVRRYFEGTVIQPHKGMGFFL